MQGLIREISSNKEIDAHRKKDLINKIIAAYADADREYLSALYFPESSESARIPSKFGVPSSVFNQRFHFYINTGSKGQGVIGIAPQDTTFRCCFYDNDQVQSYGEQGGINGIGNQWALTFPPQSDSGFIPEKFSEARLVGASMRVTYIGTKDDESGFFTGAHCFDANPWQMSEDHIEESYMVHRCKPSQGLRMVYMPKDEKDLEFAPTQERLAVSQSDMMVFNANDFLPHQDQTDQQINDDAENDGIRLTVKALSADGANATVDYGWYPVANGKAPIYYWGQHHDKGESQNPNMMVVYFKGLPKNQDWIRVDVERHWEAIPRQSIKDFVGQKRPVHNKKALDFVTGASHSTKLHTHTDEVGHAYKNQLQPIIHTVPDNPKLVQQEFTADTSKALTQTAASLGLGFLASSLGAPEFAPQAMAIGGALGGAGYDYMYGSSNQQQAITY